MHVQMHYCGDNSTAALRSFGASKSQGEYLFFIESSSLLYLKGKQISQVLAMVEYMQENINYGILGSTTLFLSELNVNKCEKMLLISQEYPTLVSMGIFAAKQMKNDKMSVSLYYKDRGINILDGRFDSAIMQNSLSIMEYQSLVGVSSNGMLVKRDLYNRVGGFDTTLTNEGKWREINIVNVFRSCTRGIGSKCRFVFENFPEWEKNWDDQ